MQHSSITTLLVQLDEYKRKYYTNLLLKGVIFSAAVVLSAYLFLNTLEYFGHFGTTFRTLLFFGFLGVFLFSLVFWVIKPIVYLYGKQKPLSNEEAAQQIGRFFPEVGDRLLNTLQLVSLNPNQNELLRASIEQKSQQLAFVKFADAVKLNENKRYLKFVLVPALVIAGILLVWPQFFTKSTTRIVHFTNEYAEEAPFTFQLENKNLKAFKNEDYTVKLNLQGEAIPEGVYLTFEGRRFKMETTDQRHYEYTFRKVQQDISFTFEAAGYSSPTYEVDIIARPNLTGFEVQLNYPSYLNKPNEAVKNTGNLTVPEGTQIEWQFAATETEAVELSFEGDQEKSTAEKSMISGFTFEKRAKKSGEYQVFLKNKYATNREPVSFFLNVIPDKYPTISLEQYRDSTLYNYLVLGGNIGDDYGVSNLRLFYKVVREGGKDSKAYASVGIPFSKGQTIQSFYYQWSTDSLRLAPGDKIEYFVQVWDNDGVNGAKSAKTGVLNYSIPSKRSIEKEIDQAVEKTESQIDKSLSKAQQLRKELAALETRLRNKRDLDFQDKKQIEELLKKKEELQNELRQLQELNQSLTQKQQRFNEQKPELAQKFEQLQKLMNELLKSDTDKLYEQLKQMLEKNQDERMLDMLDRLKAKERNSEKDLDRAMQLFKRLQREQKLDKSIEELKKLAENQEKLAQETEKAKDQKDQKDGVSQDQKNKDNKNGKNESDSLKNQNSKENPSDQNTKSDQKDQNSKDPSTKDQNGKDQNKSGENALQQEQQKLKEEMEDVKKELKDVEELNKELKEEEKDMGKQEQQEISEQQQQSMQDMKNGNNKSSSQRQKKAAQQMKSLAQKLSDMKQEAEMKENQENMDDLRDILENLVHLSFAQERVMKDFRGIQLADPRFVKLAQEQIKLQEDAKIVEDSLYSLAKRVLQIQSFVTREVGDMKKNMDDAAKSIRERRVSQATARQQFAMTNMNNLALMLSDVLKQMQENAMNMMAMGKGKPQKQKSSMPSMGKQQEKMNQQMQQTQQGNKSGKAFSEQLAQMAAQQAAIRKQLQEAMEKLKGTEAGKKIQGEVNDLMKKMDQTEEDLVNKRITPNTINRNKDILTRLLESEKAIREQEEDEKRKSETAKPIPPKVPPAFEQYVKEKQKQTELLRTVPPSLAPFYKKEVDNYFKKLK